MVRALRVGALFLPVVCPWAREGDRAALIALYEATEGAGWATNAEYAGDDPYYNQSWIGGNNFWNVIDPSQDYLYAADPCVEKVDANGNLPEWFGVACLVLC